MHFKKHISLKVMTEIDLYLQIYQLNITLTPSTIAFS